MLEHETRETLGRSEAAGRLRALADEIEAGTVSTSDIQMQLPEEVTLTFELEASEIEVKLEWPKGTVA